MSHVRVGLVLSGGGAKGAYQVGVLKALLEVGVQVDTIAGASIGALNAAILASAPNLRIGTERLEELWMTLAEKSPLEFQLPAYLRLASAGGLTLAGMRLIGGASALPLAAVNWVNMLQAVAKKYGVKLPSVLNQADPGLFSTDPLNALMQRYFDVEAIATGLPLYVSVFRSNGDKRDITDAITAELGIRDNAPSEFMHIQSLPRWEQKNALLASAAIPFLFEAQHVGNQRYTDGGLGGWATSQGNTPITPLLEAGIRTVIVTHLSDGSLWDRNAFPDATILEIRPKSSIQRDGGASDLLGFNPQKISSWIEQGYQDTAACIGPLMAAQQARGELRNSEQVLTLNERLSDAPGQALDSAMERLRQSR